MFYISFGQIISFETQTAFDCRQNCLNREGNFCASTDFSSGVCCDRDSTEPCISRSDTGGYCSKDIQNAETDLGLKYWVCPRDQDVCQDMTLIAKSDSKSYLKVDEFEKNK